MTGDGESCDFSYLVYLQDLADSNSCTKVKSIIIILQNGDVLRAGTRPFLFLLKYKCDV